MNYYEILKISKDADEREIKSAYKELVKKYHPDLYLADKEFAEKRIKEINEAYRILIDPDARLEYDEYLNEISQEPVQNNNVYETTKYQKQEYSQEPVHEKISISHYIFSKFEKLKKGTQIKIFLIMVFIILIILLNNLLKLKNTFEKTPTKMDNSAIDQKENIQKDEQDFAEDKFDYNDSYDYYYNDELQSQFNEFYNTLINEYRNTIIGQ